MQKNDRFIYLLIGLIAVWLIVLSFRPVPEDNGQDPMINEYNVTGFSTDFTKVVAEDVDSIVTIAADASIASGFVYKQEEGKVYILTAYHAIADSQSFNVIFASKYSANATLIGYDPYTDLAVLQVEIPFEVEGLKFSDAKLLSPGEFVISIGTPVSTEYASSVALGMISKEIMTIDNSIIHNDQRSVYYLDVIPVSTALENGYSGSPLINMNGDVVGMNTMRFSSELSFAVTGNEIQRAAERLISEEEVHKLQFGVKGTYIRNMPAYEKTNLNLNLEIISGLYVEKVRENSLAAQAAVRPGDVIIRINSVSIDDLDDYLDAAYGPAEEVVFEVIRNDQNLVLGVEHD
ncbi:MAG: serine protease [Erysipelotrichaceae bacterium]|nr:serine protease [Erysipelotrichaceae bacterium]